MLRSRKLLIVMFVFLSGCQSAPSALDQAGTMVAETVAAAPPTETPLPMNTPLPPDTPAPIPTSTAITALTATIEAVNVLSELDVLVGANSESAFRDGYLAWIQNEPITIKMTGPQKDAGIIQSIGEDLNAADFIFKSDVTWNASGVLICGVTFRAETDLEKGEQYQFYFYRLSGLPAYVIDAYKFGRHKYTVSDTRFSDSLNVENDGSNQFLLVAQENVFNVYINGRHQGRFLDESQQRLSEGVFGFLGWQESGEGSCSFESSWIWALE